MDLHVNVADKVKLFVTLVKLGGANIVITGGSALIVVNSLDSRNILLNVLKFFVVAILSSHRFRTTILISVIIASYYKLFFNSIRFDNICSVPPSVDNIVNRMSLDNTLALRLTNVVFSFVLVGLFSSSKALVNMASGTNLVSNGNGFPGVGGTLCISDIDSITNTFVNASSIATCVRDASNITINNHAKLATIIINIVFLLIVFFSPLITVIPPCTATKTLVFINILVASDLTHIG